MLINKEWDIFLADIINDKNFLDFYHIILNDYKRFEIYPKEEDLFKAFKLVKPQDIKLIIIGQDPYHGPDQANGLAFSVNMGVKIPPSLRNIFKELNSDLNIDIPKHGDLTAWANEGVLLLNTSLTVKRGQADSYGKSYWVKFTDKVIKKLGEKSNLVFILWGNKAQKKSLLINEEKNFIIRSAHPSPLSATRGFFGSKPFSKANDYLRKNAIKEIDWSL